MTQDVRVAVVGAGYWGKNLVRSYHRLGALEMVCDPSGDIRDTMSETYGVRTCTDFDAVLRDAKVRAVSIATPAVQHGQMVRAALEAGKDVCVEKPLCLSDAEARDLNELARERERVLMVGHLLWYHPAVRKLKEMVDAGELGQVQYVYSNRLNLGKLRRQENVLWSFAPHDVSVILGLLNEIPERVVTQSGNFLHRKVADTTTSLLEFSSGRRAHIFVSWLHPYKEQKLVVVGERKMAVFNDTAPWPEKLTVYPHTVGWRGDVPVASMAEAEGVPLEEEEPLLAECRHFVESVAARTRPRTDGEEAERVLRVLNACERSMQSGETVDVGTSGGDYFVHDTSVVDPGVRIGKRSKIWHFSHILGNTTIGERCNIGQNVVIGPNVVVGNGCKIQNNVSIYDGVELEDEVFCGPSMVFTNVSNPRAHVVRRGEYKPTPVRRGATIGANATVVCGHSLGEYCFVGAGAVVTRDVAPYALVVGNPARRIGWMCQCGERLGENLSCADCGSKYREKDDTLEPLS